ncbi:MAG: hydrolase [Acidobacteria bacterium]|nr:hydrolase [Acidobacteriota bacterium]
MPGSAVQAAIDAVLLDVGGTLIECRPSPPEIYARELRRLGHEARGEAVAAAFAAVWAELTEEHPRGLDRYHHLKGGEREWWTEFVRRVLARLASPAPLEPVVGALFAAFADVSLWHVYPEVRDVLAALRLPSRRRLAARRLPRRRERRPDRGAGRPPRPVRRRLPAGARPEGARCRPRLRSCSS